MPLNKIGRQRQHLAHYLKDPLLRFEQSELTMVSQLVFNASQPLTVLTVSAYRAQIVLETARLTQACYG